jgi:hypothetical protein
MQAERLKLNEDVAFRKKAAEQVGIGFEPIALKVSCCQPSCKELKLKRTEWLPGSENLKPCRCRTYPDAP